MIINKEKRVISPDKGKRLTDGKIIAEKDVWLGINDSSFRWYEISEEEALEKGIILKWKEFEN